MGPAPAASLFKPAGLPARHLEETLLGLDELEALRLCDHEGLYQEAAALRMGVSRQTLARVLASARAKVAGALVEGRALRIAGGTTAPAPEKGPCMKIAIPTREGAVDGHFGHCAYFTLYEVGEGAIRAESRLEAPDACGCKSGIASELARQGVTLLLAGNIGEGAVRVLSSYGIEVLRGASGGTREAAEAWLAGKPFDTGAGCDAARGAGHGHSCSHGA